MAFKASLGGFSFINEGAESGFPVRRAIYVKKYGAAAHGYPSRSGAIFDGGVTRGLDAVFLDSAGCGAAALGGFRRGWKPKVGPVLVTVDPAFAIVISSGGFIALRRAKGGP